jgi:hypothetical protein
MGLTIYYSGKLKQGASIDELTEEVKDICKVLDWQYHICDDDDAVKGIFFIAPECDPVFLTFNQERSLCSPISLQYKIEPATQLFTKTQYAGIDVHRSIITLFRHLNEKYFSDFEMMDESGYWETGDEKILEDQFERYNVLLGMVSSALKGFEKKDGETDEALAERLKNYLNNRFTATASEDFIPEFQIIKLTLDDEDDIGGNQPAEV